jgi:hypothetical protein
MAFAPDYRTENDLPANFNDLPEQEREALLNERIRLLHVYAQGQWHGELRIVGNRNALLALRDALDAALVNGVTETSAMTTDGEGYPIVIEPDHGRWDSRSWESRALPYTDPAAAGKPDLRYEIDQWRIALKKANALLFKRGVKPVPEPNFDD